MSLERAFKELEDRFERVAKGVGATPIVGSCRQMLNEALFLYREGRVQEGAWRLQDIEQLLTHL
jgi:hypothetical protein